MTSGRGSDAARRSANDALVCRRTKSGWRKITIWLCPETVASIEAAAKRDGISFAAAAKAALVLGS